MRCRVRRTSASSPQHARHALNGIQGRCDTEWAILCLRSVSSVPSAQGRVLGTSEDLVVTMVIGRWNGTSSPIIDPVFESVDGR